MKHWWVVVVWNFEDWSQSRFSTVIVSIPFQGLCSEGEGGKLVDDGDVTYGGRWVVNPSGGLISKGHPLGATGIAQCAELNWQVGPHWHVLLCNQHYSCSWGVWLVNDRLMEPKLPYNTIWDWVEQQSLQCIVNMRVNIHNNNKSMNSWHITKACIVQIMSFLITKKIIIAIRLEHWYTHDIIH